jgi:hypothetical protein
MKLQTAARKRAKIKMSLQGPSGSGKTYSSLLIAYGLSGSWDKIAVVDTENHSADLYSHLGPYNVLSLSAPYSPERYTSAIETCEKAGMDTIVLDSVTHEWENLLDTHASMTGNSFTNWGKITPRHNEFVKKILQSPCHIICTMRTKQDYVLAEKNGRMVPEKVGLKSVQRDGLEYEFTLAFDLDYKNQASVSKDRTGLFFGKPEFKITAETGALINSWCNSGGSIEPDQLSDRIGECKTIQELLDLYHQHPNYQEALKKDFETQKRRLLINQEVRSQLPSTVNNQLNGVGHE